MISATPKTGHLSDGLGRIATRRPRIALHLCSAAGAGLALAAALRAVPAIAVLLLVPAAAVLARWLLRQLDGLARHAYVDDLTGVPNGTAFRQEVARALAGPSPHAAVLLVDLDRFRSVNDTFGHDAGDDVLREIAARLSTLDAPGLVLARTGGDEFGILAQADADCAFALGRNVLHVLQLPFSVDGIPIAIGAGIGAAVHPEHGTTVEALLRRADDALRTAKENHSGIAVYDADLAADDVERVALGGELSRAIEDEEIALFFQPKVDLRTGRIVGVETLVRWRHPLRGLLMPSEFMPFAERTRLIRPLSRYVLERAIRQCAVWQTAAADVRVAVNLTTHDLVDPDLPGEIAILLTQAGLPPDRLELEITERAIMGDPFRVRRVLQRLSEMGVRIAIDDFGTGYSSLGFLKGLPIDAIEIDCSFVGSMAVDANDATIVRSAIDLGRNLGLTVVAEGVETVETLERLKELGCDAAQGYLIGRPAPAEELTGVLFAETPLTRPLRRRPRLLGAPAEAPAEPKLTPPHRAPLTLVR